MLTKRKKMVLVALILTLALLGVQRIEVESRYQAISLFAGLAYGLSAWALFEDLKGLEWLTVLILPVMYPVSVALFYFLLPERWLTRSLILGLFFVGMYALLLTVNIFNVAAIRTIQLLRAAHAVGFLLTLIVAFFFWDTIFSFRLSPWWNALLVGLSAWPLVIQSLWSIKLEEKMSTQVLSYSFGLSWMLSGLALMISFWSVTISVASLFLVAGLYVGLGLVQHALTGRLFKRTIEEYVWAGIAVLIITFIIANWG